MNDSEIIVIDKPENISSARIVNYLKPVFKGQKIGHAGTLDPFASGVLIVLVGSATKLFDKFQNLPKTYLAKVVFGQQTDTLDPEGKLIHQIKPETAQKRLDKARCRAILDQFPKIYNQQVPAYSAAKYKGKPLYWWARRGQQNSIPVKTKPVKIYDTDLIEFKISPNHYPQALIKLTVGSGFYVRQWAYDLGQKANLPAYLSKLRRIAVGEYHI